jgi:hypothetical protein
VTFSVDGGTSWSAPIDIPTGGLRYEAETDVIELKDERCSRRCAARSIPAWSVSKTAGKADDGRIVRFSPGTAIICTARRATSS